MSVISLEVDLPAFERDVRTFVEGVQRGLADVAHEAALDGAETARTVGRFQDRTGELRGSIRVLSRVRTAEGGEARFGTRVRHGLFVEAGTRPHEIRARRASALRWEQDGEIHFAKLVHHPGGRAFPFMGPGAIRAEASLYARAQVLVAREIARAG